MKTSYPEANDYYGVHSRKVAQAGVLVGICLALAGLLIGLSLVGCCRECRTIAKAERRIDATGH